MKDFKKLVIWQRSHELTPRIYEATLNFPKEEVYGLTGQMRRSSASVPTNIAEGCGRNGNPELARFCVIAAGSTSELEYQLILARDLQFINEHLFQLLTNEVIEIRMILHSFIQKLMTDT